MAMKNKLIEDEIEHVENYSLLRWRGDQEKFHQVHGWLMTQFTIEINNSSHTNYSRKNTQHLLTHYIV